MKHDIPSSPQLAEVQRLYRELQEVRSIQSSLPILPSGKMKETLIDRVNNFLNQGILIKDLESKIESLQKKIVELDSIILSFKEEEIKERDGLIDQSPNSRSTWTLVSWMKLVITIVIILLIIYNNSGAT